MTSSVRVLMNPLPAPQGGTVPAIVRGQLRLTNRGSGKSLATKAAQPASLVFTIGLIQQVRPPEKRTDNPWVTIAGTLALVGDDQLPQFTIGGAAVTLNDPSLIPLPAPPPQNASQKPPQSFLFEFDEASFIASRPLQVPLPDIAPEVRHIEIQVELQIGGTTESSNAINDVLDKPVVRQLLHVSPRLCLDTPVSDPTEHNLAFLAAVTGDTIEAATLHVGSDQLVEGQDFFQHAGQIYFRPVAKPVEPLKGLLVTTDGRSFDFELKVAQTLRDRMNSLAGQLANMGGFAEAATQRALANGTDADGAALLGDSIASEALQSKMRLLDSIEGTLSENRDFALFYARSASLPPVYDSDDDGLKASDTA
ncbi:MAG: hypothetical protein ABI548_07195 [Polyangiaceae bacterium]